MPKFSIFPLFAPFLFAVKIRLAVFGRVVDRIAGAVAATKKIIRLATLWVDTLTAVEIIFFALGAFVITGLLLLFLLFTRFSVIVSERRFAIWIPGATPKVIAFLVFGVCFGQVAQGMTAVRVS